MKEIALLEKIENKLQQATVELEGKYIERNEAGKKLAQVQSTSAQEEEKQKKMQKEADAENPLRKTISSAKQVTNVQTKIENIVGEIQTLQDPPNIEDLSHLGNELTTQENRIQQLFNEVMANINRT